MRGTYHANVYRRNDLESSMMSRESRAIEIHLGDVPASIVAARHTIQNASVASIRVFLLFRVYLKSCE